MTEDSPLRKILLLPLSKLYGFGTAVRNKMYDWKFFRSTKFDIPVISVGNISVGGTGKTPHTEYIIGRLRSQYNIAMLSRGYKRATKGFVQATPHTTPRDIGDEPYQIFHKFGRQIMVAVCEDRVAGIEKIREINPQVDLIVLDDAMQHRAVTPQVSILLTEYNRPFYEDKLLPYGRLRESAGAVQRADIVIVTKCPKMAKPVDYMLLRKNLNLIPEQDLFFTRYHYDALQPVYPTVVGSKGTPDLSRLSSDYTLLTVTGIANPRPFVRYVKSFEPRVKVNVFPDHHEFTRKDMQIIKERFDSMPDGRRFILTTEKDAVRLINNPYFPHQLKPYIFYIPVHVTFVNEEKENFDSSLAKFLRRRPI